MTLVVRRADVRDPRLVTMLAAHSADMYATSPPESVHTLDLDALAASDVVVLTVWETGAGGNDELLGCGAVKIADVDGELCGEIKSMRTEPAARGRGVASMVIDALNHAARAEGATRLYLETGPQEFFAPARALYAKHGFAECGPFGDYPLDPYSFFMTRTL